MESLVGSAPGRNSQGIGHALCIGTTRHANNQHGPQSRSGTTMQQHWLVRRGFFYPWGTYSEVLCTVPLGYHLVAITAVAYGEKTSYQVSDRFSAMTSLGSVMLMVPMIRSVSERIFRMRW